MTQTNPTTTTHYTAADLAAAACAAEERTSQLVLTDAIEHLVTNYHSMDRWPALLAASLQSLARRHHDPPAFLATLAVQLTIPEGGQ